MNNKPRRAVYYSPRTTHACESLLVALIDAFGEHGDALRLIGGLVPRYLAPEAPPEVPAHVGSNDVDVVLDIGMLGAAGVPAEVVERLKAADFTPYQNGHGGESPWQWEREIDGCWMRVDFLVHTDDDQGFAVQSVGGGALYASAIPFAGMAARWYVERTIMPSRPDGSGETSALIRHIDGAAFVALKALTLGRRNEPKDVADIVHVLRYLPGAPGALVQPFAERLRDSPYQAALARALDQLQLRFCTDDATAGWRKDGPKGYVDFHDLAEDRELEQRNVSGLVTDFVTRVRQAATEVRMSPARPPDGSHLSPEASR